MPVLCHGYSQGWGWRSIPVKNHNLWINWPKILRKRKKPCFLIYWQDQGSRSQTKRRVSYCTWSPYLVHFPRKTTCQIHSVFPSSKRLTLKDFSFTLIFLKSMHTDLQGRRRLLVSRLVSFCAVRRFRLCLIICYPNGMLYSFKLLMLGSVYWASMTWSFSISIQEFPLHNCHW